MEIVRGQQRAQSLCYEHVLISTSLCLTLWSSDSATSSPLPISLPVHSINCSHSAWFCLHFHCRPQNWVYQWYWVYSMAISKRTIAIIIEDIAHKSQYMWVASQDTAWLPSELFLKNNKFNKTSPQTTTISMRSQIFIFHFFLRNHKPHPLTPLPS